MSEPPPENAGSPEFEVPAAWQGAARLHNLFKNLMAGGFTEDQALRLAVPSIAEGNRNAAKT